MFMVATTMLGLGVIASILFTLRGLAGRSWVMMWVAALASLAASIATIFSIGALVFLIACLQLGAAVALRQKATPHGWLVTLLLGILVWTVVIPLQILVSDWLGSSAAYLLLTPAVVWLLAPALPVGKAQSEPS